MSEAGNHDFHKDGEMALALDQRRAESAECGVRGESTQAEECHCLQSLGLLDSKNHMCMCAHRSGKLLQVFFLLFCFVSRQGLITVALVDHKLVILLP